MPNLTEGLNSWLKSSNHNRMLDFQEGKSQSTNGSVDVSFYGGSAFKITSPMGITTMLDPWRNLPTGKWDWYFYDFPKTEVDIGVSTHAHFDHDALHLLDASVNLDRLIGTYEFQDVKITGIADKHATDSSAATYDFKKIIKEFGGVDITPPNNPRSWDNCLIKVETGGISILHWGDNRHNPPDPIWDKIGHVDIALLPVDESQHVLSFVAIEEIIDKLNKFANAPERHQRSVIPEPPTQADLPVLPPIIPQYQAPLVSQGRNDHQSPFILHTSGNRSEAPWVKAFPSLVTVPPR